MKLDTRSFFAGIALMVLMDKKLSSDKVIEAAFEWADLMMEQLKREASDAKKSKSSTKVTPV